MASIHNLTGMMKGRLTGLRCVGRDKHGNAVWLFRCACDGKEVELTSGSFVTGKTASCGCIRRERAAVRRGENNPMFGRRGKSAGHFKHGHSNDPTYQSWMSMIQRCTNSNHKDWIHYGGANLPITVCERWLGERGFENFLTDMGERPSRKHSLGRFGDIGDYCKENCAWQTSKEQHAEQKIKRARIARQQEDQVLEEIFGRQAA